MTPPREIRNFLSGRPHLLPDLELNAEASALRRLTAAAAAADESAVEIEHSEAVDRFSLEPTLRYGSTLAETYREMTGPQLEAFIHRSLAAGRRGERVSYFDALGAQFALLRSASSDRIAALTRQFVSTLEEYSNFLQYAPGLSTEERLRFLFAAARIGQTYLGFLRRPPSEATLPENVSELRSLLGSAFDEVDDQLQAYYAALAAEHFPSLPRLTGVMEIIGLRRALHAGDRDAQRHHALALANHLSAHPPTGLDESWQARAERSLLEDPEIVAQLRHFDAASVLEARSLTLNAHSLELLILAAASLDRANEEEEIPVGRRYQQLSAVVTPLILRHPEWTLEESLRRLRSPSDQADLLNDLDQIQRRSADLAGMLSTARGSQSLEELLAAAREAAVHVAGLGTGPGQNLFPGILTANRIHHPLVRLEAELLRFPSLVSEMGLPASQPGRELLRRRGLGLEQFQAFQLRHPELNTESLRRMLQSDGNAPNPTERLSAELLETWEEILGSAPDHEIFALHSLFSALEENHAEGGISAEQRQWARRLRERSGGSEFQTRRMLRHLFSSSNLLALGVGILATEFLPSLIIARAGLSGSLAIRGLPLVTRGSLTSWGSAATGIGTGLGMSLIGSGLHNLDRHGHGLTTHFWRDFGSSALLNTATFGLTLPFSRLLQNRLAATARDSFLIRNGIQPRNLSIHAGTVAFGSFTALGLGFLGRGLSGGQWSLSREEIAENVLSMALWEFGAAGLRHARGWRSFSGQLGPHRAEQLRHLVPELVARNPTLAGREPALTHLLARAELQFPGTLQRYQFGLESGRVPRLSETGSTLSLRLLNPSVSSPSIPPAPMPGGERPRPVVIIWERAPVLRLPAETDSEAPITPSAPRSEPPEAHPPPVALQETAYREDSPYHFEVLTHTEGGEAGGIIEFGDLGAGEGEGVRVLGRGDFPFLSPELRRTLSRRHLEVRLDEGGGLLVRNLSDSQALGAGGSDVHGSWYFRDGQWHSIPWGEPVPLNPHESVAIGNRAEPVQFQLMSNFTPSLSRVSLGPSRRLALGALRIIRSGESSLFRLAGAGETPIEVTRSLGDDAGNPRRFIATDNPVIGEIGEEVRVDVGAGEDLRSYLLRLDSPDLPASMLPEVRLEYGGGETSLRFRSSAASLDFGRNHQPGLFTASYISRNHFRLSITADQGHPRYLLLVEAPHGLAVGGQHFPHGSRLGMFSGVHELMFRMDAAGRAYDGPVSLHLPPIEASFPDWNIGPFAANHDRAAPSPPPLPPRVPAAAQPAAAQRNIPRWRSLLDSLIDRFFS